MKQKKFYTHGELHSKWMKNPKYVHEYEMLEPEFVIARAMLDARIKKRISQKDLAQKMETGQAVISRLESGKAKPSIALLQRLADAIDAKLEIRFIPR